MYLLYEKRMIIGYTAGVYDMFHIGHLNMLKAAKSMCDRLIVGVTVDELVRYKGKDPIITYKDRALIVESIKYTDLVVPQNNIDKIEAWKRLKFDVLFVGDDWYNTPSWNDYESELKKIGVKIVYIPYTVEVSSTILREKLNHE